MDNKKYTVAIVGATGVVGREIIQVLESRDFPAQNIKPLASKNSIGQTIHFKGISYDVEELTETSFEGIDFALFSAGSALSEKFAPIAAKAGALCIDNTSHFRMDPNVPLVVPEVNVTALVPNHGIIANPNCSTAQMVLALKPIYDAVGIKRIVISTYQSVSGAGKDAMAELEGHSRVNLAGGKSEPKAFSHTIAFNVIPKIDVFLENGYTKEEIKMVEETKKILEDDTLAITATCVRVPVFIGHSEALNIETKKEISEKALRALLAAAPGVCVEDDPASNTFPTPRDVSGKDDVYIGRIRKDISQKNTFELWCVGDNLRKGAALNAVQIAEAAISQNIR